MKKILFTISLLVTLSFNSHAVAYDQANWYVTVDINQVRNKIMPLLSTHKNYDIQSSIKKNLPPEVQQITVYGHSEIEDDLSMVVSGAFSTFTLNEYINNLMYLLGSLVL